MDIRTLTHGGNPDMVLTVVASAKEAYNNGRSRITLAVNEDENWYVGIESDGRLYSPNMYGDEVSARIYFRRETR